jgi:hypothetical protein
MKILIGCEVNGLSIGVEKFRGISIEDLPCVSSRQGNIEGSLHSRFQLSSPCHEEASQGFISAVMTFARSLTTRALATTNTRTTTADPVAVELEEKSIAAMTRV